MSATETKDKAAATPARVPRRGPRPLAQDVGTVLRHQLGARGFTQIELVTRWFEIAGAQLASHCLPYRLSAGGASGATLTLIADDRAALELQHQVPKVIDKINAYFGRLVVGKIKVVTGDIPQPPKPRPRARDLSVSEETELQRRLGGVEDPGLREALLRLGRLALAEGSRKPATPKR